MKPSQGGTKAFLTFYERSLIDANKGPTMSEYLFIENWVIDPRRAYARVVVYNRDDASDAGADLIVANHGGTLATEEPRRFTVYFQDAGYRGRTERNGKELAETGQNPVRYVAAANQADEADQPSAGR